MGITAVLKDQGDIKLGIADTQLYIMPDDHTQLRANLCGMDYPNVGKIMQREYPEIVETNRDQLIECINRSKHVIGADRTPLLKVWFGREEIAVAVLQEADGLIDVIETPGFCTHVERHELGFGHQNLVAALINSPNNKIKLGYDPDNKRANLYIDGGSGYEAWVATRRESGAS
jgi:hypothetical protein